MRSRTFLNQKDSDIASKLASEAGLSAQVEATSTTYKYLAQHNQSSLAFLMQRAWRIGYECFVEDGKLYFRKPPTSPASVTLKWGEDLLSFHPRMTLAEQVDSVEIHGWDPDKQQAIVGTASSGTLFPKIGESKNGKQWASTFGSAKYVVVDQPVVDQAEATKIAEARFNEISGGFIEAEGVAFRRPDIKAGTYVKLEQVGTRFSGEYLVTNAQHVMSPEGFKTTFTVRGIRTGSLAETVFHAPPIERWGGAVTAVVTNTNDPDAKGRIKVKFPWLDKDSGQEIESDWARVAAPGAGKNAGFCAIPEVNDEVIVVFEHGDFNRPTFLDAQPGTSTGAATTTTGPLPTTTGDATTTTGDPGTTTTTTTTGDASTSDGESTAAPPEQTCRDILECVGMCALNFDLACFQMCAEGVPPEEGQEAIALGGCILQGCFTSGKCTPETLMDIACLGCIGIGVLGGKPDGCEAEAEACT